MFVAVFGVVLAQGVYATEDASSSATGVGSGMSQALVGSVPPMLLAPSEHKTFSLEELKGSITFRWTAIAPKPTTTVTYRLKVWQLMQGQNGAEAIRSNQPIVTKDVENITEVAVASIITGPCKPPYLCDFVWNVQARNSVGSGINAAISMSKNAEFRMTGFLSTNAQKNLTNSVKEFTSKARKAQDRIDKLKKNLIEAQAILDKANADINELSIQTDTLKIKELKSTIKKELTGTVSLLK